MKSNEFPYKGLHHYLDVVFTDHDNPNDAEIIAKKKEYWKLYYKHYRNHRRRYVKKEFTMAFDKNDLNRIHDKRENLSVSEFLYWCVEKVLLNKDISFASNKQIDLLSQNMMGLISLVEELMDQYDQKIIEDLLDKLDKLEEQITMLREEL